MSDAMVPPTTIDWMRELHRHVGSLLNQRAPEISDPVAVKVLAARAHLHAAINIVQREKEKEGAEE